MAQRRMFSKTITNASQFLMMPSSSQNLYFHLGMNADDDGFCEHFTIMRMTDSKPDDLKILQAKNFINVFDDRVLIISDWKENNYLRADRYTPSKYLSIYKEEIARLSSGIPVVDNLATQVRIGKDRLGEDRRDKDTNTSASAQVKSKYNPLGGEILKAFEEVDSKNKTYYANITQRKACDFLLEEYGLEEVLKRISILTKTNKIPYFPAINTPHELKEKWIKLNDSVDKKRMDAKTLKDKQGVAIW